MKTFEFYGVDNNCYKLGNACWEAIEDEADGWRSYLGSIERINESVKGLIFSQFPLATVFIRPNEELGSSGFDLVDAKDCWIWLSVGTDYHDDWYPMFVFRYNPKPVDWGTWKDFISEEE